MKVCRVCLAMGVKMYHISEYNLSVMYEQVTGLKMNTEDNLLPKMLCWECVGRLSSAHNFMKKALKTHLILVDKIKSSRFISMGDIDSIDKTQLKSTLGVKFYKDNYSYIHIVKESDNCYEDSEAEIFVPNYVDINNGEEQIFVTQDVVSAEKDPIKKEYSDGNEEQISEYENNIEADIINESVEIKFQNTEFKTEMLETSVTENASDQEMVIDNESKAIEMSEEKNHIKVETTEVYDPIKQNRKRKRSEAIPHCKEPRVVLEDVMLSFNKYNTKDNSQSAKDNDGTFFRGTSIDNILLKEDNNCSLRNDKHTNNSVFNCNYCTFETSVRRRLTYHINTKHLKRSFNCTHCDFVTYVKSRLIGHVNAKHTKDISFNCSYCTYNTYFKKNLDRHINVKHTKKNIFKCSFCNYKAYDNDCLTKHVNAKHTKTNVFVCSYCSFISYQRNILNRHVNAKHTKNLSFNCSLCDYKAYTKDLLKGHINAKHTKINSFTCSYCSFKSFQQFNLNRHVNAKHTKSEVFNCSFCNYKAYNKIHLKRHINSNHTKMNVFICSYCNLRVYYKSTLIRHIKAKHS